MNGLSHSIMMKTKSTTGKLKIAYTEAGKGDTTILLLPGWCANRTVFDSIIPLLSKQYHVLSIDWRGHGESANPVSDFGINELVDDALAIINESKAKTIIPVALSHAGWVAIKLKERLGNRLPKIVLLEWILFDAPAPFMKSLSAMQQPEQLKPTLDFLFAKWINNVANPKLTHFVMDEMGSYQFDMWCRAGREISNAYNTYGNPLKAISNLKDHPEALHLYGQPDDQAYLQAQENFTQTNSWFKVQKLNTKSHFPMFEKPDLVGNSILSFAKLRMTGTF
jgi:pimeloyl-ACP methyl ester carboxylesterase